jgi:hypothetical protein
MLYWNFTNRFQFCLNTKRLSEGTFKKEKDGKKEGDAAKNATPPVWWSRPAKIRTFWWRILSY